VQHHSFRNWLNASNAMFWVQGKPGAGKSVLMKYLLTDQDGLLRKHLQDVSHIMKAGYFFRETREHEERCANGMLRTILVQIFLREMKVYQKSVPALRQLRLPRSTAEYIKWTNRELYAIFHNILQGLRSQAEPVRMLLFIDGLDECLEPEVEVALSSLHKLLSIAQKHNIPFGICISTRPSPGIDSEIDLAAERISLDIENRDAIHTYIRTGLTSRRDMRRREDYYGRLAEKVAERAEGVFLWVALVVPRLRKKIDNGGTLRELEALLRDIPIDLRKLFIDILHRISRTELGDTMRMLQIATLARRRLKLDEFQHALAFQPSSPYTSMKEWKQSPDHLEEGQMVIARLQNYSGGLLEVREESGVHNDAVAQYKMFLEKSSPRPEIPNDAARRKRDPDPSTRKVRRRKTQPSDSHQLKTRASAANTDMGDGLNLYSTDYENIRATLQWQTAPLAERLLGRSYDRAVPANAKKPFVPSQDATNRPGTTCAVGTSPDHPSQIVQFIHETAKDFFREKDGFKVLSSLIEDANEAKNHQNPFCSPGGCYLVGGHDFIVDSCLSYLKLREIKGYLRHTLALWSTPLSRSSWTMPRLNNFPLTQYISESLFYHLRAADEGQISQQHVLEWLISVQPSALNRYICWAGEHNIISWVVWCIENEVDVQNVDATLFSYGRPIKLAVAHGLHEMTELLIHAGANVNGTTGGRETTLRLAERMGDEKMAAILKKHGGVHEQLHWLPPAGQIVRL
jgi:hypothetical protein